MNSDVRQFLVAKVAALDARARRLARLTPATVGIRRQDRPYTPGPAHFRSANQRLAEIDREVRAMLTRLHATLDAPSATHEGVLRQAAMVERAIDRARRAFALYFEVLSQRGTAFAPALAACDNVSADCFHVIRAGFPELLGGPLLKPVSYVEGSFSPATFRRGVMLRRLLGERNPFPLVRVPHERLESPWGFGVVLHEVAHNLQADLRIWQETERAVQARVLGVSRNAWLARIWTRWHKEIFADLAAILLGGPSAADGMKDFLAYPASRVLAFRVLSVHPVPYLRAFLMAEMVARMGFQAHADRIRQVWHRLYSGPARRSRIPGLLLETAPLLTRAVVDEIAFQPRRGLAGHTLVDVIPFTARDEQRIRHVAMQLGDEGIPKDLPPRFLVGVSRYALERRVLPPDQISQTVISHLANPGSTPGRDSTQPLAA